jgi:VacB/RNase II family 3'-5' exoribonuclease
MSRTLRLQPDRLGESNHRTLLARIAAAVMEEKGLEPEFSDAAIKQAAATHLINERDAARVTDLRKLPWCSIDNDDSLDLDQLSSADALENGATRIRIAIADVAASVERRTPLDKHAHRNTTSIYTPARKFPMLPDRLSTNLTSLNESEDRFAIIVDFVASERGAISKPQIYRGRVRNQAKLSYREVGRWLEHGGETPNGCTNTAVLDQLRLQDRVAEALRYRRDEHGALEFETVEVDHLFEGDRLVGLKRQELNRATSLIANMMIAANGITSRFLEEHGLPVIRRVVREPEHWDRICEIAAGHGTILPVEPDPIALSDFLEARRAEDRASFPDFSLTIIKLLGRGEYVVDEPGVEPTGHFGLAVRDYTHSTAPNRRYPDLVTQRMVKSALEEVRPPYELDELRQIAAHCTEQEDAANKVERHLRKSAAALLVSSKIGERFEGLIAGVSEFGRWVRIVNPPIEGKVVRGAEDRSVGDPVTVRLLRVDVARGFIDFEEA